MNILLISGICLVTAAQCLNAPKSQQNGDGEIRLYYVINKEEKLLFSGRPNIEERLIQNIQEEEQWIEEDALEGLLPTRTDSGLFLDVYDRIKTRHEAPAHGRKHPGHHNSRRHNSPRFNGFPKMNGFKFPKFSFRG
ncbi:unnamed protein product [Caenorhabditis brenneri]